MTQNKRPPAPVDSRPFRERALEQMRQQPKPAKTLANKPAAGDGIARRVAALQAELETTVGRDQRAAIKRRIAAAKRGKNQWDGDMAVITDREARATDPKYLEAVALATSTLEAVRINESLHQGFLDAAESNLKELRHSLDYEAFAVRQANLKELYDADRAEKRAAIESHRAALGDDIALLSSEPAPTDPSAPRPNPGGPTSLFG